MHEEISVAGQTSVGSGGAGQTESKVAGQTLRSRRGGVVGTGTGGEALTVEEEVGRDAGGAGGGGGTGQTGRHALVAGIRVIVGVKPARTGGSATAVAQIVPVRARQTARRRSRARQTTIRAPHATITARIQIRRSRTTAHASLIVQYPRRAGETEMQRVAGLTGGDAGQTALSLVVGVESRGTGRGAGGGGEVHP